MDVEIGANRARWVAAMLGGLLMVALSVAPFVNRHTDLPRPLGYAGGAVGILFFGMCTLFAAQRSFDRRPALVLTGDRLINRSSMFAIPEVPWREVTGTETRLLHGHMFLLLHLRDTERVLAVQRPAVRIAQRMNLALMGSVVIVAGMAVTCPLADLQARIEARLR